MRKPRKLTEKGKYVCKTPKFFPVTSCKPLEKESMRLRLRPGVNFSSYEETPGEGSRQNESCEEGLGVSGTRQKRMARRELGGRADAGGT